jgi:hypothetical protein
VEELGEKADKKGGFCYTEGIENEAGVEEE